MTQTDDVDIRAFLGAQMTPDEVLNDTVLFDADALAAACGGQVHEAEGGRGVSVRQGQQFTLDAGSRDLSAGDQLIFTAYVPAGDGLNLGLRLETSSRTQGIEGPDQFFTSNIKGPAQRLPEYGWGEMEYPVENFHVHGIPDGWKDVTAIHVTVNAHADGVLVGELRLQKRRKAPGPRLTDDGLLKLLDPDRPELSAVRSADEAGDVSGALAALLDHYRQRVDPQHIYGPEPRQAGYDTAAADRICRHFINGQQLSEELDWRANPIGYLEWMHAFNRHGFFHTLLEAYCATGTEKYAEKLDELVHSWIRANPVPLRNNGGGDPAWETLSTAVRVYGSWLRVFFGLQESPRLRDETRIMMLKSLYAHAEHLMERSATFENNWLIVESQAVALIGMLFPEFRRSQDWRSEGWRRLAAQMGRQIHPDGMQYELSPGYHVMSVRGFLQPYRIAKLNGSPLPEGFEERLASAHRAIMRLTRPDVALPAPNDSGGCSLTSAPGSPFLAEAGRLFSEQDMLWVGTGRQEGTPPRERSVALDHAGYYVMRSGWSPDDRYLFFDAGPLGKSHQHEDKLNFELYAYGQPLILDPGISSYMRERWTDYYRSTAAHNTLLLDGKGQCRRRNEDREAHHRSVAGQNTWLTGDVADFVSSAYGSGYDGVDGRFVHRRSILFVRDAYWVLFDEMAGEGEHRVDWLFHFRPTRVLVDAEHACIRTSRKSGPNLDLLPWPHCACAEATVVTGRQDPVQGWISVGGEDVPAPTGIFSLAAPLPVRMAVLMAPYNAGTHCGYATQRIEAPADVWACEVTREDGATDRIAYRWRLHEANRRYAIGGRETAADVLLIRRLPDGSERIAEIDMDR